MTSALAGEHASSAPEGLHRRSRMRALAADHLMQQHSKAARHTSLCQKTTSMPHHNQLLAACSSRQTCYIMDSDIT